MPALPVCACHGLIRPPQNAPRRAGQGGRVAESSMAQGGQDALARFYPLPAPVDRPRAPAGGAPHPAGPCISGPVPHDGLHARVRASHRKNDPPHRSGPGGMGGLAVSPGGVPGRDACRNRTGYRLAEQALRPGRPATARPISRPISRAISPISPARPGTRLRLVPEADARKRRVGDRTVDGHGRRRPRRSVVPVQSGSL